jgi:phosphoglycolate phosphatase-like HAD superfamily hydrolase
MVEVLEALEARDGVRLAVLTGNLEPIAHLKLARAGLGRFFESGQGGFGSDREDRTELPAIARARAGDYPRAQTVVIGDTPRDIACARADGVRCIAVATGPFTAAQLADADVVLESAHELLGAL